MTETGSRRRLGRGLGALLGPTTAEARADGSLRRVPLSAIRPNPYQPRRTFDESALGELTESLRTSGLLQPVVVRPAEGQGGLFELIAGERRWRAAERLGWTEIGAVVREVDDRTLLTLALVENLQRDALSPIDEAQGYSNLIVQFNVLPKEVGELVGRDRSTIANALRLLKLPDDVQQMLHSGKLFTGHARTLLQLDDARSITKLATRAVAEGLSVRELEALTRGDRAPERRPRKARGARQSSPAARRVEQALRDRLRTDVLVTPGNKGGGRITLNFYSSDDLARLLELILGHPYQG